MAKKLPSPATAKSAHTAAHDTARLEALFSSIGEGVIATDEKASITRINQAALDLLGYRKQQVMGKYFPAAIVSVYDNGKTVDIFDRPIVKAFLLGKPVSSRMLYKRSDGSLLPVQITVSPIVFQNKPIGAIEVFRDLTLEIENDKLKSDFISIASHQLRTPLSAINMYTRMLQDGLAGDLAPAQQPYIQTILNSVERMNILIDTLLNITRIEAGGIKIKLQSVQAGKLSQEVLAEFVPTAKAKDIELVAQIADDLPRLTTDNLLVREICANLLSNAIKYTDVNGTVQFSVQATPKEICWKVTDNGYGIPLGEQKHIFSKFFRAENITKRDVSGTGLGLYLIKSIAEKLGGEIGFESKENVGSSFYFSLPLQNSSETTAAD